MCHEDARHATDHNQPPTPDGLTIHRVVRGGALILAAVLPILAAILITTGWNAHDLRWIMCGCALGLFAGISTNAAINAHGTIVRSRNEHALYDSLRDYLIRVLGRTDDLEVGDRTIIRTFREATDARVSRLEQRN
ncbi:hypothetical protein [Actinomadura sp. 21ATH]|uniref:hypothetical protein n=1 Tax=Actinomadura sp. 21ATH TaxID=1735444 RepID=UPI0035C0C8E9